ncbi:MAG: High-affinity branched-chain amino acid transport ATP-binding protein LivF [Paracidovorax wautersii]|uniref:High-affinity branched-chain amino acid transport ATP-binding protein LivF n=1 Tax=Paracidovorax wautersii TaxID=1177982 RepID=A0A7V8FLA6_9BURK|nr:MAG: High-affinity branched-chain amino acid transport ATP-binding protein LivF [Paracidovorax wautersii]
MSAAPSPALSVTGLQVRYGHVPALEDLALTVRPGEVVTVIGPNGAGKSSLLNAIAGALPVNGWARGGLALGDVDISRWPIERRVAEGLCLVPESRELFGSMSVADNLLLGCWRRVRRGDARPADQLDHVYTLFPRLHERRQQAAATLSGGERQMLALGRALMARPAVLMLDEPSLGLAPLIVREIFAIVERLKATGVAVLLVEQNARAALRVADRAYVLETGRVVLHGPAAEVARDPRVAATYLGRQAGAHLR